GGARRGPGRRAVRGRVLRADWAQVDYRSGSGPASPLQRRARMGCSIPPPNDCLRRVKLHAVFPLRNATWSEPMAEPHLDTTAYLRRLGFARRPAPTLATLRELQLRHTSSIAFETISTLLHAPVPIDLASLQRKVLGEGRGGYCYELNLLFLALLRELGFDARGLTGRVVMGGPEDAMTARTHMLVLVELDGRRHVTDVGFGGMVPTAPL